MFTKGKGLENGTISGEIKRGFELLTFVWMKGIFFGEVPEYVDKCTR